MHINAACQTCRSSVQLATLETPQHAQNSEPNFANPLTIFPINVSPGTHDMHYLGVKFQL